MNGGGQDLVLGGGEVSRTEALMQPSNVGADPPRVFTGGGQPGGGSPCIPPSLNREPCILHSAFAVACILRKPDRGRRAVLPTKCQGSKEIVSVLQSTIQIKNK